MVFDFCDHESSENLHCGEMCHEFLGHSYLCLEKLFPYFLKAKFMFFYVNNTVLGAQCLGFLCCHTSP